MDAELHASSAFSFLRASSLPEDLVARAAEQGYGALALLDRDGVFGAPRFHKAARAAGIRPIVGAELTIAGIGDRGSGIGGWHGAVGSDRWSVAGGQSGTRDLLIPNSQLPTPDIQV